MGVISASNVTSDMCFGPIPTALMIADPAYLIGNMTSDVFPEIPPTTVNLSVSLEAQRFIDWVPYLRSARCDEEQNLELVRHRNGDIFYRITKPVPAGQELLIWFSKEYCREISMPTAEDVTVNKETNLFQCEQCCATFKFVLPFICHQTFKCKKSPRSIFSAPGASADERGALTLPSKRKLALGGDGEGSAFRKVTRASPPICDLLLAPALGPGPRPADCFYLGAGVANNNNNAPAPDKPPGCPDPAGLTFSLLPPFALCGGGGGHPQGLPPGVGPCPGEPAFSASPGSAVLPAYAPVFVPAGSPPLVPPPHASPRLPAFPFARSNNPMVEKLLQSAIAGEALSPSPLSPNPLSALNLTQNWCAKCNATFRMTSDLVYHMRTHHKREGEAADAARVRRHDKLRCEVCGETFRERHHLTRHMTSHD